MPHYMNEFGLRKKQNAAPLLGRRGAKRMMMDRNEVEFTPGEGGSMVRVKPEIRGLDRPLTRRAKVIGPPSRGSLIRRRAILK